MREVLRPSTATGRRTGRYQQMIYMVPSIVALAAKLYLAYVAGGSLIRSNRVLGITFVALVACNLLEINSFYFSNKEGTVLGLIGLKLFYAFAVISGGLVLRLSIALVCGQMPKAIDTLLVVLAIVSILPLAGDWFITDYRSVGYAITRVEGPYYWAFQLILVSLFLLPSLFLAIGGWVFKDARSRSLLFCSLPMALLMASGILLVAMGCKINACVWFSIATTIFAVGIIYTESKYHRFALLSSIPGTWDNRAKTELTSLIKDVLVDPSQLKKARAKLDQIMAVRCLDICSGNVSEAAKMLEISPRTLKRKSSGEL